MGTQNDPCPYCGVVFKGNNSFHFIPCTKCNSLEHAGCQH